MIILFDETEKEFTSLGLGVLRDAIDCNVTEKLNDAFELEMSYDVSSPNFDKIREGRILYVKPNPYDSAQPFRIYAITKPIKGVVTIKANHISYDTNGIPVKQIDATGLNDVISQIQNGSYIENNFKIMTDIPSSRTFKTFQPYNLRALLMGSKEESLIGVYNAELKFDKHTIYLYTKRGKNRGAQVCYGYNMTDLKHQTNTDKLYNGVFPYYHKETTQTETTSEEEFPKMYIVGSKPFQDGWLSYSKNGDPYHPLDSSPVQIDTEGDYYQKVYTWDTTYQKYVERAYNQTVTLIEGVIAPNWIVIDWSQFPNIICRANAKGYYKLMTDDDWGEIKGVGDVIFQGNIIKEGLSGMTSNMMIYFSEVIPSGKESQTKEVTETVDVILDNPILKITTPDANQMRYNNILSLDLTSEFDEEPTKEKLQAKAEEFIAKHQLGTISHTTEVSFIDLKSTTDAGRYKNFEHVELGDTVRVIYRDLGVDTELRVIEASYNAISGNYDNVVLGVKEDNMSSSTIQNGDNISSLSNDVGYADITTVNKLVAKMVTAEFINAVNAKLSKAQIEQLQVEKINCTGIIEASQFTLDELIAKLLIADNAKIKDTLEAGQIKVAGDVDIKSGAIRIEGSNGTSFVVDREGNVTANSMSLTGGTFNINDGMFEVTNDGVLTAKAGVIGDCYIDEEGHLKVPSANIVGTVEAGALVVKDASDNIIFEADKSTKKVQVGSFTVDTGLYTSGKNIGEEGSFYISPTGKLATLKPGWSGLWALTIANNFGVTRDGVVYAGDINARGFFGGTANVDSGYIGDTRLLEAESKHFGLEHPVLDPSKNVGHAIVFGIAAINSRTDHKNLDNFLYSVDTDKMVVERDSETEKLVPISGTDILNSDTNSLDRAYQVIGEFTEDETGDSIALYDEPKYYIVSKQYGTWIDLKESGVYNEYTNTALKLKKYLNKEFESSLVDKNVVRYDIVTDAKTKKDYIKIKFRL